MEHWKRRKSPRSHLNVFFMASTVVKHGAPCDQLGIMIQIKGPKLIEVITGFMGKNVTIALRDSLTNIEDFVSL